MKINNYQIVTANDSETVQKRVQYLVEQGFEPHGSLVYNEDNGSYSQAVIKRS